MSVQSKYDYVFAQLQLQVINVHVGLDALQQLGSAENATQLQEAKHAQQFYEPYAAQTPVLYQGFQINLHHNPAVQYHSVWWWK